MSYYTFKIRGGTVAAGAYGHTPLEAAAQFARIIWSDVISVTTSDGASFEVIASNAGGVFYRTIDLVKQPSWSAQSVKESEAEEENSIDPVTQRLIQDALPQHGCERCPSCGHRGRFIRMALTCPTHGVFGGC